MILVRPRKILITNYSIGIINKAKSPLCVT